MSVPIRLGNADALLAFLAARAVPGVEHVEGGSYGRRLAYRAYALHRLWLL